MDGVSRRKFLSMLGAAPAIPIAMKVSNALGNEIIEPVVLDESESGIVLANHIPSKKGEYRLSDERLVSYRINQSADNSYSAGMSHRPSSHEVIPFLSICSSIEVGIEVYKKISRLLMVSVGDILTLVIDIKESGYTHL